MRMRAWIVLVLGAGALASACLFLSWRSRAGQTPATGAGRADGEPASELSELKREVQLLKAKSKLPQVFVVGSAQATTDQRPPNAEEQDAIAQDRQRRVAASLEHKLASEVVDTAWSRKRTQDIREVVAGQDARTAISSVTCASTLCRLVLDHDSLAAQKETTAKLAESEPFDAGVFLSYDEAVTPPRTTLYLLREGHDFHQVVPTL